VYRLFVNGVVVDTETTSGSMPSATGVVLGATATTSYFQGRIAWARAIRGKALWTADFVKPRWNVAPPRPGGCGAYYCFDLDKASHSLALGTPTNSYPVYGTPGPRGRQMKFTSSQYLFATVSHEACVALDSGSDGRLFFYDSTTFNLSNSDFTIDFWVWGVSPYPIRKWGNSGERCWRVEFGSSTMTFYYTTDGVTEVAVTRTPSVDPLSSTRVWRHYAVVRTGNVIRLFQDGVQCGTDYSFSGTIYNSTTPETSIGYSGSGNRQVVSYVRITIGSALWTGTSFTVPTKASYTVGANTKALLPLDHDHGFMQSVYYPRDLTSISRVWSNPGGARTVYNNPFSKFHLGSGDFTIECWIYHDYNNQNIAISNYDFEYTNFEGSWYMGIGDSPNYRLKFATVWQSWTATKDIPAYTWTHIAVSRVGSTLYLATNGVSESCII
jgi:hypothetical protein